MRFKLDDRVLRDSVAVAAALIVGSTFFQAGPAMGKGNRAVAAEKAAGQSIAANIRLAELIIIGTYANEAIKVKEVLKGDKALVGQSIKIPLIRVGCGPSPQSSKAEQAVLFTKGWKTADNPWVEVYQTPDQVSALRCLMPVIGIASEHKRLVTLSEMTSHPESGCKEHFVGDAKPIFRQEFLSELREMRDPANFVVVEKLFASADPKFQLQLIEWIGDTADQRAVPLLISALKSPDRFLPSSAATKLMYYYPGAKGVDAALLDVLRNGPDDLKPSAYRYLSRRNPSAEVKTFASKMPPQTPYQRAEELRKNGKTKEAVELYLSVIESAQNDSYVRRASALTAVDLATPAQKDRIRVALLPMLAKDSKEGNYLEAADTAVILRKLHHMQCLDSLLSLLDKHDFMFTKPNRSATMAIRELGPKAKKQAAQHLLKQITATGSNVDEQERTILSLAWLGDATDLASLKSLVASHPNWQQAYQSVFPMLALQKQADEGKFLIDFVQAKPASREAKFWAIYRLGELKDKRAVALLINEMKTEYGDSLYTVDEALKSIGGPDVVKGLQQIATMNTDAARKAVNILSEVEGARSLPLLRQIARAPSSVAKSDAFLALGRLGTSEDLAYLVPMSDYWKGDRANHYWIIQAISGIRDRHI